MTLHCPRGYFHGRGSAATHYRSGGNQPAYQSMINRPFSWIVPLALPSRGHSVPLAREYAFLCLQLETANMRVDRAGSAYSSEDAGVGQSPAHPARPAPSNESESHGPNRALNSEAGEVTAFGPDGGG